MSEQNRLDNLFEKLRQTQQDIEEAIEELFEKKRKQFQYNIDAGKVIFDKAIKQLHRKSKVGWISYIVNAKLSTILTAPIIYGMVIPIALFDLTVTIYQHICFRVYKIPIVNRSRYIVIDHQHLAYLNAIEKLNCIYCGYGNGAIAYAREIFSCTEQYWCPIKHAEHHFWQHKRSENFVDYGDVEAYREKLAEFRKDWSDNHKDISSEGRS